MVNANRPCHPLAFDKRMVRRMALLIRAGTNFISWTYFSPKNSGNCGKIHASKGSWESQGLNSLHQVDVPESFWEMRRVEECWFFLRPIQVDFSKPVGSCRAHVGMIMLWQCENPWSLGATEPVEHVGKSWSISQSHPVFFAQANPSESEHSLPVASYINLMGTYQWDKQNRVQNILGYYGIYSLVI